MAAGTGDGAWLRYEERVRALELRMAKLEALAFIDAGAEVGSTSREAAQDFKGAVDQIMRGEVPPEDMHPDTVAEVREFFASNGYWQG